MENTAVHIGQLNRQVEIFQQVNTTASTGEAVLSLQSVGKKFASRRDLRAVEDTNGRLTGRLRAEYVMRYSSVLMHGGEKLVLRDDEGDFFITGVMLYKGERQRRRLILIFAELDKQ